MGYTVITSFALHLHSHAASLSHSSLNQSPFVVAFMIFMLHSRSIRAISIPIPIHAPFHSNSNLNHLGGGRHGRGERGVID